MPQMRLCKTPDAMHQATYQYAAAVLATMTETTMHFGRSEPGGPELDPLNDPLHMLR